ncbi:MAG: sulfotransferase, partial [Pseudomonadota bacterium]
AFPDARLILATRSLGDVHRSAVSLVANQMAVQCDTCDLAAIEAEWHRKITMREERRAAALKRWSGPVTELSFEEINTDWESAITRAYQELDLDLTPAALSAMRQVAARNQKGAHTAHSAQLSGFSRA